MQRSSLVASWLVLGLAVFLLTFEGWLPGQALLPLAPGDFPAWQASPEERVYETHPAPNANMSDVLHLLLPALASTKDALARGELPSWDGSQALGFPPLAQLMHGVYYPPAWLPLLFGLLGLGMLASFHLFVASAGTLLYLRSLGRSAPAALLGAIAFGLGAWMTARVQAWPVVGAAVWMPWILLGLERAARGEERFTYGVAALGTALSLLAGFPQVSLLVLCTVGVMELARLVWRLSRERRDRRRSDRREGAPRVETDDDDELLGERREVERGRRGALPARGHALRALLALSLGGLLAAPLWVPTLDYMTSESDRAALDPDALASEFMELPLLHHLLVPDYYAAASLSGPHPLALGALVQARLPVLVNRAETSLGIGVLPLLLAIAAMVFGRHWLTRTWAALVLLILLTLLTPPLLRFAVSVLPPLQFGSPRRLLLIVSFGLAVLAAGGLDLLRQARLRVAMLCWGGALAVTAWALLLFTNVPPVSEEGDVELWVEQLVTEINEPGVDAAAVRALVPEENFRVAAEESTDGALIALLMGAVALIAFRPRAAPDERGWVTTAERSPGFIVVLLSIELLLVARPLLRPVRTDEVSPAPSDISAMHMPPLASALRGASSAEGVPTRFVRFGRGVPWLRPAFAGMFGLSDVSAYLPMVPRRTANLMEVLAPRSRVSGSHLGGLDKPTELLSPLLRLLAVDAVLSDIEGDLPGWSELANVGGVRVLVPDEPMPRARITPAVRVLPDETILLKQLTLPNFDPDAIAYVTESVDALAGVPRDVDLELERRGVQLVRVAPGRFELQVESGAAGLLVLSETFHAGWDAELEGEDLEVLAADGALIGVALPAGEGGVLELEFAPFAPRFGQLLGLLGVVLLGYLTRRGPLRTAGNDG